MKKLYPSCSEIVWRLNGLSKDNLSPKEAILRSLGGKKGTETFETDTSTYPNSCIDIMFDELKDTGNLVDVEWEYLENQGGGGDGDYVEDCFKRTKDYLIKKRRKGEKITDEDLEKLQKIDEKKWGV